MNNRDDYIPTCIDGYLVRCLLQQKSCGTLEMNVHRSREMNAFSEDKYTNISSRKILKPTLFNVQILSLSLSKCSVGHSLLATTPSRFHQFNMLRYISNGHCVLCRCPLLLFELNLHQEQVLYIFTMNSRDFR